jgi:hypothetical protein
LKITIFFWFCQFSLQCHVLSRAHFKPHLLFEDSPLILHWNDRCRRNLSLAVCCQDFAKWLESQSWPPQFPASYLRWLEEVEDKVGVPAVTPKWRYFHFRHLMKILVVWTYHRTDFYLFSLILTYFWIYFWRFRIDHRRRIFLSYILKNRFGHKKNFGIMYLFSLSGGLLWFFLNIILFPMAEFPRGVVKSSLILMLKDSIYLKVIINVTSFSIWICFKMRCPFLVPK